MKLRKFEFTNLFYFNLFYLFIFWGRGVNLALESSVNLLLYIFGKDECFGDPTHAPTTVALTTFAPQKAIIAPLTIALSTIIPPTISPPIIASPQLLPRKLLPRRLLLR